MRKVVLVSRLAAGYDADRFVFIYDDLKAVRFYGNRPQMIRQSHYSDRN